LLAVDQDELAVVGKGAMDGDQVQPHDLPAPGSHPAANAAGQMASCRIPAAAKASAAHVITQARHRNLPVIFKSAITRGEH
jgi:hypothetical protein